MNYVGAILFFQGNKMLTTSATFRVEACAYTKQSVSVIACQSLRDVLNYVQ